MITEVFEVVVEVRLQHHWAVACQAVTALQVRARALIPGIGDVLPHGADLAIWDTVATYRARSRTR